MSDYGTGHITAQMPFEAHTCNCIGCCSRCGSCRTWRGHTAAYCDLIVSQLEERLRVAREDRAAEVRLRGEERVAELEKEANRP